MTSGTATGSPDPTIVHELSQLLLYALGKTARVTEWKNVLKPLGQVTHSHVGDTTHTLQGKGVQLSMVELEDSPGTGQPDPKDPLWGLQSATFTASSNAKGAAWSHELPLGLQATNLDKAAVQQQLGPAVVSKKAFSLFECKAKPADTDKALPIGVQCEWGPTRQLTLLTLLRLQDFAPLPLVKWVAPTPTPPAPRPPPPSPVTCRSREPVPKTGVYEGKLPASHKEAKYFSTSSGRFCLRRKGEEMIRLGVTPFEDEALVVWTWVRERW